VRATGKVHFLTDLSKSHLFL